MLSLGAGLYEELLFRVLLVSGLLLLARRVFRWRPALANALAVGLSALIFSAFRCISPYGDALRLDSFVFSPIGIRPSRLPRVNQFAAADSLLENESRNPGAS